MIKSKHFAPLLLAGAMVAGAAQADGFLKIPDIEGEATAQEHENEIDFLKFSYSASSPHSSQSGSARQRANTQAGDVVVEKKVDAASPYLLESILRGKMFPEVVLTVKARAGGKPTDHMVVTLSNARITSIETEVVSKTESKEHVSFAYEKIKVNYTETNRDGSGDEHEIEYNVATGG